MARNVDDIFRREDSSSQETYHTKINVNKPPDQMYALINISSEGHTKPYSEKPAFRVLGIFDTFENTEKYTKTHYTKQSENVYCIQLYSQFAICKSDTRQTHPSYGPNVCKRATAMLQLKVRQRTMEFRERIRSTAGEDAKHLQIIPDDKKLDDPPDVIDNAPQYSPIVQIPKIESNRLDRNLEVRGQIFVVFSLMDSNEDEPVVTIYAAFDNEDTARTFIIDGISHTVLDEDLHIANMYEWIFPHVANDDRINEQFRLSELNTIMAAPKIQQALVEKYQQTYPNRLEHDNVMSTPALVTTDDNDPQIFTNLSEDIKSTLVQAPLNLQ